jgi:hypothetical protein
LEQAFGEADETSPTGVAAGIDLAFAYANLGNNAEGLAWALRAGPDAFRMSAP